MACRWSVGGMAAAWLVGACGGESGLLIEVTRDDRVPANVGRLAFHVGIDAIAGFPQHFVDLEPDEEVELGERDLAEDPYRLMIRPDEHPDALVMVAVVAYRGPDVVGFGALAEPVRFVDDRVSLWPIQLSRRLPDGFAVSEIGCLTWVNEGGQAVWVGHGIDPDCDGWANGDCDDLDPSINPGAAEICGNAADEDCDDVIDENVDEDADLVTTCDGDCNDGEPTVFPGAAELCDGLDNNCNTSCDEGLDGDGDTYTVCGSLIVDGGASCFFGPELADCDDAEAEVNPGAAEVCDGRDDNCDQVCDDGLDGDADGFTACGSVAGLCVASELYRDCDERDGAVFAGAAELCNGIDDDCDGQPLQRAPCFAEDQKGICFFGERDCAEQAGDPGDWIGDCAGRVDPLNLAPDELCAGYASCDAADDPDPYACSIANATAAGLALTGCEVTYQVATGEQCPGAEVVLPTGDLAECTWAVVGGTDQVDYVVGLRDVLVPEETPGPFVPVCGAVLSVAARRPGPPSPHQVLLARTDTLLPETTYFVFSLESGPAEDCAPPAGLTCEGLSSP